MRSLATWALTLRQLCDLELLTSGGFDPVRTFLGQRDYESVCEHMRLADGSLWPIPMTLDIDEQTLRTAERQGRLVLTDPGSRPVAVMTVTEAWRPDHAAEAESVLGTTDPAHPSARHLMSSAQPWYVAGQIEVVDAFHHHGLPALTFSPAEVRDEIGRRGWTKVVAFNTRNPMHQAHRALVLRALEDPGAAVLLHPVVGPTRPGDVPVAIRARCHIAVMRTLPTDRTILALIPLAMRMAGPREALWHALIRRNYGATHFVVGRDHAGPGKDSSGRPFYPPYAAQKLVAVHRTELGVEPMCLPELGFVEGLGYLAEHEVPPGAEWHPVSGTRVRQLLAEGAEVPAWLTAPEVVAELAATLVPG
jgi:ATP sulfurylase